MITYGAIRGLLLVAIMLAISHATAFGGLVGLELVLLSIGLSVFVFKSFSSKTISPLIFFLLIAAIPTTVNILWYPELKMEYAKASAYVAISIYCGYVCFLYVLSLPRALISKCCLILSVLAIVLSLAEIAIPSVRSASEALSVLRVSGEAGNTGAGREWLEYQSERDLVESGTIRPILGTVEPSRVASLLALAMTGYNLTRVVTNGTTTVFILLTCFGMLVTRSPTFVLFLMAGNLPYLSRVLSLRSAYTLFMLLFFCAGLVVTGYTMRERLTGVSELDDSSINYRLLFPLEFARIALTNTWGLGIGLVGEVLEPDRRDLEVFLPWVLDSLEKYRLEGVYDRYIRQGNQIAIANAAFLSHWIYQGIWFGTLSLMCLVKFAKNYSKRLGAPFLCCFFFVGLCGGPYYSAPFWCRLFVVFAFCVLATREKEEQSLLTR